MTAVLVADSGSTKTEWMLLGGEGSLRLRTAGYNPYFDEEVLWEKDLRAWLTSGGWRPLVRSVYYYGAGCDREEVARRLVGVFRRIMPQARVRVADDLTGAGAALWQREHGGVLILGTGMNAGIWDGKKMYRKIIPMGYLLGDHASGATLGLRLVKAWLDGDLSPATAERFEKKYALDRVVLKQKAYVEGRPNFFFASLTPFYLEFSGEAALQAILEDEFDRLFRSDLLPLFRKGRIQHFRATGSIAWYFREMLGKTAATHGLSLEKVIRYPIEGLAAFHGSSSS